MSPTVRTDFFGNDAQVAILKRGQAMADVVRGDGRFSCHGRAVGLVSPDTGDMYLIERLAQLQGSTHYACVGASGIDHVLASARKAGLNAVRYARWEIDGADVATAGRIAAAIPLPDRIELMQMTAETTADVIQSFAGMSLGCGVLPAWISAHTGEALTARTLLAVTDQGRVVSSAYAAAYISDQSEKARRECFWGMLATDPEWRGQRLSLILGGTLMRQMQTDFGFTAFYTGVEPGNVPSEAVCGRLGLRQRGSSIVTLADVKQLPGGRMTK